MVALMSNWVDDKASDDAVQNHRLDSIERRLDKHDEMLQKLVEAQTRSEEQMSGLSASVELLAESQTATQDMINGIGQSIVKWMMGLGSVLVTAMVGVQGVM